MQCEVCGDEFQQLMVHTCGKPTDELCGPLFDSREHQANGYEWHKWYQLHNCIRPEADRCYYCGLEPQPAKRPACCR